jgi:thioredoxin reductase (NADPH)
LELWHPKKGTKTVTTRDVVIAVGGRPKPLACEGGDLAISSDDIFWRKEAPGKTLVVGASYVALECAGFMKGMGYDVKIMVRSILLRGFDQDMADKIGEFMEVESKIEFIRGCVPQSIMKLENGQLLVKWTTADGEACEEAFDTVLNATGRDPDVAKLGLDKAGVKLNPKTGRIWVENEQTSTPNVYAIGDVIDAPELTPVAIQAGRLLARRLYNNETTLMDYDKVCTAVFTPIEYGCCGLSEEASIEKFGEDNLEIYHQNFTPLEWSLSSATRPAASSCYVKVICDKSRDKYVVGFHYLGPNAGEVTQAMGLAMKLGFTYDQMVNVVGIHPTTAEIFTTLEVTKSSGASAAAGGC